MVDDLSYANLNRMRVLHRVTKILKKFKLGDPASLVYIYIYLIHPLQTNILNASLFCIRYDQVLLWECMDFCSTINTHSHILEVL